MGFKLAKFKTDPDLRVFAVDVANAIKVRSFRFIGPVSETEFHIYVVGKDGNRYTISIKEGWHE